MPGFDRVFVMPLTVIALADRFGLFTTHTGGSYVKLYLDDLAYTAGRPAVPRS